MKTISLIIPAFNEQGNIIPFYERCKEVFQYMDYRIEYIYINDGSYDDTAKSIKTLIDNFNTYAKSQREKIIGINFSRNFGKEAAIFAGLERCTGDYVSIIDADLQQDPSYVKKMVSILESDDDVDCVACYQSKRNESAVLRFFKSMFYKFINGSSNLNFQDNASDFRLFKRNVVDAILAMPEKNRFSKGIFSWVGFNTVFIPYEVKNRASGTTTWSFSKLFKYALDGILGFSDAPLKIATYLGFISACAAFIYFVVVLVGRLVYGVAVPGYATIVCLILIIGGIQMMLIGMLGEYIGRIFMEVKNRPIYLVKSEIESKEFRDRINED